MTDKNEVKEDFLEVDDPIGGQQFVCLSFVSPEDVIQNKEAFKTAKFLQSYSKDKGMEFKEVYEDYLNFQYKFQDEIQRDYDKENKGQTNIRGVKVRGVYSSKEEAEARAKKLHRLDSSFHVFIGQVGYWLPWNPCADKIEDEQFLDSGLNELMEKYKENNINKDLLYEEQKREKMKAAQEEVLAAKKKEAEEQLLKDKEIEDISEETVEEIIGVSASDVSASDVSASDVSASDVSASDVEPIKEKCDDYPDKGCDDCPQKENKLDESLKSSLENADPWLQNKIDSANEVSVEPEVEISEPEVAEPESEVAEPEPEVAEPESEPKIANVEECKQ